MIVKFRFAEIPLLCKLEKPEKISEGFFRIFTF
jgi:hypothetical protein